MAVSKKDFVKTAVFAFMVSIVVVFAILELKKFKGEEDVKENEKRLVAFGSSEIFKLKYNEYSFERDGKKFTWKMVSPITDFLNYRLVEDWVSKGLTQEGRDLSEHGEDVNWSDFELDNKENIITYETEAGEVAKVQLSKKEAFDGSTYLKVFKDGSDRLYSSSVDWKELFSKKAETFRSRELFNWEVPSPGSIVKSISFSKKGKKYFSLSKSGERWISDEFKDWTFDKAKVESFIDELKTYLHDGFAAKDSKLEKKEATISVNTDSKESYSLNFYKNRYVVSSYRPEHILKADSTAQSQLVVDPLDLRSFKDLDANFPIDKYDQVKIKIKDKIQKFSFENGIWVLKGDDKNKERFNGARVFIFLDNLKKINYKRYVPSKGIIFKSAKKRIYLLKDGKEVVRYSIGQAYPCEKSSKRSNCVLVSTGSIKGSYALALKKEIDSAFRFSFLENKKIKKGASK